jgi:anti-sigma factor RsiW
MSPIVKQMTCAEVVALVTDYLEGELAWRERRSFRRHLEGCDGCTTYLAQMETVVETLGHLPRGAIPPVALDRLMVAFRDFHRA